MKRKLEKIVYQGRKIPKRGNIQRKKSSRASYGFFNLTKNSFSVACLHTIILADTSQDPYLRTTPEHIAKRDKSKTPFKDRESYK